jgi:hypothetical protein
VPPLCAATSAQGSAHVCFPILDSSDSHSLKLGCCAAATSIVWCGEIVALQTTESEHLEDTDERYVEEGQGHLDFSLLEGTDESPDQAVWMGFSAPIEIQASVAADFHEP